MPELSPALVRSALRLSGARPDEWLCLVCGAVVADEDLALSAHEDLELDPPVHEHYGRRVELVWRPQL